MRAKPLYLVYLLLGLVWAGLLRATLHSDGTPSLPIVPAPTAREKHYVSPAQLSATGMRAGQPVPPNPAELIGERPLVLVFLKDGCPCNGDIEPVLHRLFAHYGDQARFAALIDGSTETANQYTTANRTPYPVLADPDRSIIRAWQVENGGWIALVRSDGTFEQMFPGYSRDMLQGLNRCLAQLTGLSEAVLSLDDLPGVLTTGCPYP
jgi:hypothetical protein